MGSPTKPGWALSNTPSSATAPAGGRRPRRGWAREVIASRPPATGQNLLAPEAGLKGPTPNALGLDPAPHHAAWGLTDYSWETFRATTAMFWQKGRSAIDSNQSKASRHPHRRN